MKFPKKIIVLTLWVISYIQLPVIAQQTDHIPLSTIKKWKLYYDQLYGADYSLVNGTKYLNLYPFSNGHPFLGEDQFYTGNLMINNQLYQGVEIKYDVHNQQVILQYHHFSGSLDRIILIKEFINEFEINGKLFRQYNFSETNPCFYQVVTHGEIYCLYYWTKEMKLSGSSSDNLYKYMPEKKESFLVINQQLYAFKDRRSFLKLLPEENREEIKQFMKSNKIWLINAGVYQLQQLLSYCNELIQSN